MDNTNSGEAVFRTQDVPFPVTVPFRMQPGLVRLDDSLGALLRADSASALHDSQRAVKQAVGLNRLPLLAMPRSTGETGDSLGRALNEMWHALAGKTEHSVSAAATPGNFTGARLLDQTQALRAQMQDDFVLLTAEQNPTTGNPDLRANLMAVAMPSGWDPAEKLGQRFLELHQHVADADLIRQAASPLCAMMQAPGALRRHVWTLTASAELSSHPDDRGTYVVNSLEDVWFRCERQTTYALEQGAVVLFLIRVYVVPLLDMLRADRARAALLHASLDSMSPAVVAYKSLQGIRPLVLQALAS